MRNPIGWFEIYVDDMARARRFYEAVFAVELQPLESPGGPQMLAFPSNMEQYGCGGALVQMDGLKAGGNSTWVYFSCADCAVEEARVVSAGGRYPGSVPFGQAQFPGVADYADGIDTMEFLAAEL